jgi:hypothetical protein
MGSSEKEPTRFHPQVTGQVIDKTIHNLFMNAKQGFHGLQMALGIGIILQ